MIMNFEQEYFVSCSKPTDINEHLPLLAQLASECTHITELGVGPAQSTRAFLLHEGIELHCYEFQPMYGIPEFFENAKKAGRNVTLHVADTRQVEIAETDLLMVDSLHVYEQVQKELELHAPRTRKYIVFHDTSTFADKGEFGGKGIWPAIAEFMESHPEWLMVERRTNNNGLTVIKRV